MRINNNNKGIIEFKRIIGDKLEVGYLLRNDVVIVTYDYKTREIISITLNGSIIPLDDKEQLERIRTIIGINKVYYNVQASKKINKRNNNIDKSLYSQKNLQFNNINKRAS